MKCPECVQDGRTSKVYDNGCSRTLMGGDGVFWDEEGERHLHDPNWTTSAYKCSNGHHWVVKSKQYCPQHDCSYGREPT